MISASGAVLLVFIALFIAILLFLKFNPNNTANRFHAFINKIINISPTGNSFYKIFITDLILLFLALIIVFTLALSSVFTSGAQSITAFILFLLFFFSAFSYINSNGDLDLLYGLIVNSEIYSSVINKIKAPGRKISVKSESSPVMNVKAAVPGITENQVKKTIRRTAKKNIRTGKK